MSVHFRSAGTSGRGETSRRPDTPLGFLSAACGVSLSLLLGACATQPLLPHSADGPPLALVPASSAGVADQRTRFREIYCAVLEAHGHTLPDYRPCGNALTRLGSEPGGTGASVHLGTSRRGLVAAVVQGIGFECFDPWLEAPGTVAQHLRTQGFDQLTIQVDALSSSANNALQIRDALMAIPVGNGAPRIVLVGYSKGAPDILEALVAYPEIHGRVAAVVSAAGAVGGSPLANDAEQYEADLLRHFPGATCSSGDGGAVASLRPQQRKAWLAENSLPPGLHYYSLVTYPDPERISRLLRVSYRKLSRIDARNDGQVLFYDQVVPGSTLLGYVNADHWAIALPIARSHRTVGSLLLAQNAYPREALLEAVLRFIEEDLADGDR